LLTATLPCISRAQAQWNGMQPSQNPSTPLKLRVADGDLSSIRGTFTFQAETVTLTPNATNYVFLDLTKEPPVLTVNTTGFPSINIYQISVATTNSNSIVSFTDARPKYNNLNFSGNLTSNGPPTGSCNTGQTDIDVVNGNFYICSVNNIWVLVGVNNGANPGGVSGDVQKNSGGVTPTFAPANANDTGTQLNVTEPVQISGPVSGQIKYSGITSGSATVGVADVAGTPNRINFPTSTGSANQCWQTDGNNPQQSFWGNCTGPGTISGTGTTNTITKWTGTTAIGNSSATDDGTNPTRTPNGLNTAASGNYTEWTVDTGGVTANKLACRSSSNKVVICPINSTTTVLGVAQATVAASGTALIGWGGKLNVISSNATTAGHWLIPSTSVTGDVDDTGSTSQPTTGTQTFLAETSVSGGSAVLMTMLSADTLNAAGGAPCPTCVTQTTAGAIALAGINASRQVVAATGNTIHGIVFPIGDQTNTTALTTSNVSFYITVPMACTIQAYNLTIDAGTITVKFWKIATGTAIPTATNSISTSGVSIASGTAIHSATLTDFTTTSIAANDIMAMAVTAVSGAHQVTGVLQCQ